MHNLIRKLLSIPVRLKFPSTICSKLYDIHYKIINKKLYPYFRKALKHVNCKRINKYNCNEIIWMLWWQGKDDMPFLVKRCIQSVIKHSNKHKVILITKYNVKRYAKLPKYIYYKLYINHISLTHFSDILRFNLLMIYGGLWIDSTVFCAKKIPCKFFNRSIVTLNGGIDKIHNNIAKKRWTEYLIGGKRYNRLFQFMDYFFKIYCKSSKKFIDYFVADYALNYAYKNNIGGFKQCVDHIQPTPETFQMIKYINKKYNPIILKRLFKKCTFFKLTYKKHVKRNKKCLYYKLINNDI